MMTSRAFRAWARTNETRSRSVPPLVIALVAGVALAAWVAWASRAGPTDGARLIAGTRAWLAGTVVAFGLAFLRVPFHVYWRADAALLAQLPIEGAPLFDAALARCARAAFATTLAALVAAAPLARVAPVEVLARHAAFAVALGFAAALFLPAVAIWAASLVVRGGGHRTLAVTVALATGAPRRAASVAVAPAAAQGPPPAAAMLGALPGFAGTVAIVAALIASPWLTDRADPATAEGILGGMAVASVLAIVAARRDAGVMGAILRDVSALDRQRLATLEIRGLTAIERAVARLVGAAAPVYAKDARLMRRRYPMAYALGALAFLVLAIVGLARPRDPSPWLLATLGGAAVYGLALATRLARPPIELPRLTASLPFAPSAAARARIAWLAAWWAIFVAAPALFASLRQADAAPGLALLAAGTALVLGAGLVRR